MGQVVAVAVAEAVAVAAAAVAAAGTCLPVLGLPGPQRKAKKNGPKPIKGHCSTYFGGLKS